MKTAAMDTRPYMSRPVVPLPNAASRRHVLHKALDSALIVLSGVGIALMLLFFLVIV